MCRCRVSSCLHRDTSNLKVIFHHGWIVEQKQQRWRIRPNWNESVKLVDVVGCYRIVYVATLNSLLTVLSIIRRGKITSISININSMAASTTFSNTLFLSPISHHSPSKPNCLPLIINFPRSHFKQPPLTTTFCSSDGAAANASPQQLTTPIELSMSLSLPLIYLFIYAICRIDTDTCNLRKNIVECNYVSMMSDKHLIRSVGATNFTRIDNTRSSIRATALVIYIE